VAVRIRLTRTGRKNLPSFRISVYDAHTRRDGPALEILGWFNPLSREAGKGFKVDADRINSWVARGALVTEPVRALLRRQGVAWVEPKGRERTRKRSAKARKAAGLPVSSRSAARPKAASGTKA
jgi:small subunit ribosomal protein S16